MRYPFVLAFFFAGTVSCGQILGLGSFSEGSGGGGTSVSSTTGTGGTSTAGSTSASMASTGGGTGCAPGSMVACYTGAPTTQNVGKCADGKALCSNEGVPDSSCVGQVLPTKEDCSNPADEDCDGFSCSETTWAAIFGDADEQRGLDVAVDPSSGAVYVVGSFKSGITFGSDTLLATIRDGFVAKLDAAGKPIWAKGFGAGGSQAITSVAVDTKGDVLILGSNFSGGALDFGFGPLPAGAFVAKLTSDGTPIWSKSCDVGTGGPSGLGVDPKDNSVVFAANFTTSASCGLSTHTAMGGTDILLAKFDTTGTPQWTQSFGGPGTDTVNALAVGTTGHIVMAGSFNGSIVFGSSQLIATNNTDGFLVRFDAGGNHSWHKQLGDSAYQTATAVAIRPDAGVIVAGSYQGTVAVSGGPILAGGAAYVIGLTASGTHAWSKSFSSSTLDITGLAVNTAGNAYVAGSFSGAFNLGGANLASDGTIDGFIGLLDGANGDHVWSRGFTGLSQNDFEDRVAIALGGHGEVHLAGSAQGLVNLDAPPLETLGTDVFVGKIDP
jgi:hypothetical protein